MPRKANVTIGTVTCPHSGEVSAVRKDAGGRLYYITPLGKCTPYTPKGQDWMLENAIMWGPSGAPPSTPDWIAAGRASPPETIPDQSTPVAVPGDEVIPDPEPELVPHPEPTADDDDDDFGVMGFT